MEEVTLKIADNSEMLSYVARPKEKSQYGIIVLQEAFASRESWAMALQFLKEHQSF